MSYSCTICNKKYKTYQTLWFHNKKFHTNESIQQVINSSQINASSSHNDMILKCKYCNKIFQNRSNRWRHEKKCKIKENEIIKLNAQNKQKELELKIKKEEATILRLKLKLEQSDKIENITLKKLNKKLMQRNNLIKNSTVNSNNVQNNIVNNFQLIGFGKEEVAETLTNHEKKIIMNAKYCSLEKLIEIVHCNKYNQFKNIIITNMKDNYMYKYDDKVGIFRLSTKSEVLNSLIDYRIYDLEVIYNDLLSKNKLDDNTKDCIEKFINKVNYDDKKYMDFEGKHHQNYKQYKINEIKVLLFNNQDKITKDISLLLTTSDDELIV
jgi:hypothetical protein